MNNLYNYDKVSFLIYWNIALGTRRGYFGALSKIIDEDDDNNALWTLCFFFCLLSLWQANLIIKLSRYDDGYFLMNVQFKIIIL